MFTMNEIPARLVSNSPFPTGIEGDLRATLEFIVEIDRLKTVVRQSPLAAAPRRENDAEHSWHLAVMVMLLSEYSDEPVDVQRCLELVLIHDLIEIYAGDTALYDDIGGQSQVQREVAAANELFTQLPAAAAERFRALWDEFKARQTPEARFAKAMDRLQPTVLNWMAHGGTWQTPGVTTQDVRERKAVIGESSTSLWAAASSMIEEGAERGWSTDA